MKLNGKNQQIFKLNRRTLSALMLENNWSLSDVADQAGISRVTLYRALNYGVALETLIKIAEALNVKASELVTEELDDAQN